MPVAQPANPAIRRRGRIQSADMRPARNLSLAAFLLPMLAVALGPVGLGPALLGAEASQPAPGRIIEAQDILNLQREPEDPATGRYDWGPTVMFDDGRYRMWWVRLGGDNKDRFPYSTQLPDGQKFEFTYPDWGDRIYCAESRDGTHWPITGSDFAGPKSDFGPDATGPLRVLGPANSDQERHHVGCPSVVKVAGVYYMYYEAPCEYVVTRRPDGNIVVGDEYHNQVFVATSRDGKVWSKHPDNARPMPIVPAPDDNRKPDRHRYGLGQPSVFHRNGRFVMHYVDSCTAPGDFIVRIEADNPFFADARPHAPSIRPASSADRIPAGAVARFAQHDVKPLASRFYLVRPAYGTGNLNLLASRDGLFRPDAHALSPKDVFPQVHTPDPRGERYLERLYPRFLTTPEGEIWVQANRVTLYYASGLGFKGAAYTWDLHRCELNLSDLAPFPPQRPAKTPIP